MSVKLRFEVPAGGGMVQRSRSFTGFSSLTGHRRSLRSKNPSGRSPRVRPSPGRSEGGIWGQPEQVDRIFQALRNGLKEYLESHQTEMDLLSYQQRDTKRNSRLAFLYDLEKELRVLERYIRRLEFQISKVEELYETYCIQRRLCQGAVNMKRAFSLSPSSHSSRESLLELNRNHRLSLEDMSVMEGELEMLLGELHIRMKGLIGFARLCPGDQYEVVVSLGRQRWRIRGKIKADDQQFWEEEEMVFLPHIHQNFEIKVMEVKGLGSMLVGMVTCESVDFFLAKAQLMVVDITELGTIKLQLEVLWNPFDSSEIRPLSSSPSRHSLRKSSVYSWSAPNTPSFTEKYFISMVRQMKDPEGSFPIVPRGRSRGVSLRSYLSDNSNVFTSTPTPSPTPPSYTATPSYGPSRRGSQSHICLEGEEGRLQSMGELGGEEWTISDPDTGLFSTSTPKESQRYPLLDMQRYSTPDILRQNGGPRTCPSPNLGPGMDTESSLEESDQQPAPALSQPVPTRDTPPPTPVPALALVLTQAPDPGPCRPAMVSGDQKRGLALRLGGLLGALLGSLHGQSSSEKELGQLDQQLVHLSTILKNDLSTLKASEETLAVEEVLGSFDFLSNADDDTSCFGSICLNETGISLFQEKELEVAPLTSGNWSLDQTLETHMEICTVLLEALKGCECALVQRELLTEVCFQTSVLEKISHLLLQERDTLSANDILPRAQQSRELQLFWDECTSDGPVFSCPVDMFQQSLRKRYIHRVKAKQPGQPHAVFSQLLQEVQASSRMVLSHQPPCSPGRVTIFQLSSYLCRWGLQDLAEHISRLSKEVYLVSSLRSPKRRRVLKKLQGRRLVELLPLVSTLQVLACLQIDSNQKICKAAAACLCRAGGCKAFRSKAVVFYTASLKDSDVRLQQAACLALKCLRATESVDQIAELWRSTDEDLRSAARETVLSFGKKGHQAFQRMDQIYCEIQEKAYQNQDTEITIL